MNQQNTKAQLLAEVKRLKALIPKNPLNNNNVWIDALAILCLQNCPHKAYAEACKNCKVKKLVDANLGDGTFSKEMDARK